MRRLLLALVAASALAAGATACGDDGPNDQRAAVDDAVPDEVVEVRFDGASFDPAQVTLPVGGAVELLNGSDQPARFVADGFDTGDQDPADSVRLTFPDAGRFSFTPSGATTPSLEVVVA